MLGHGATGQFAIGQAVAGATAETITPDKWYQPLSAPPRFKPGLRASQQQFSALSDPLPFVSFSWFEELSKPPVLSKPGLKPSEQQFLAFYPAPSPFVATGWFEPLSEPVRRKPGLPAALQDFFAIDTAAIPASKLIEWFVGLSEPPRSLPGLRAALQQFLAAPSRLLPTPTTTGVLAATETKDTFLGGARAWNRVTAAEVGVTASATPAAQIGVAVPVAITSAKISIV